jgi:hypothetical protein
MLKVVDYNMCPRSFEEPSLGLLEVDDVPDGGEVLLYGREGQRFILRQGQTEEVGTKVEQARAKEE